MRIAYALRRAMKLEMEGRRPVGRQKKTCSNVVEGDMRKLTLISGSNSYHVCPQEWETRDIK